MEAHMADDAFGPFPDKPTTLAWYPSPSLRDLIRRFANKSPYRHLGIALVDLSGGTSMGYAGWNDSRQIYVASLAKIGAMFAAFQLRKAVRAVSTQMRAVDADELWKSIADAWKPAVSHRAPNRPADFPKLKNIFSAKRSGDQWEIDFTDNHDDWQQIIKLGDGLPRGLGFRDRLKLMIGNSNNRAAASCIDDIGFQYLNGALAAQGLFEGGSGGLWIALDYGGHSWGSGVGGGWAQGATAYSVARFLALLETKQLVDLDSSNEMQDLMSFKGHYSSWFVNKLQTENRAPQRAYGKIGLDGTADDCAVIERSPTIDGKLKLIRYGAVGLGASGDDVLNRLIMKLDDCMIEDERMAKFGSKYLWP